MTNSSRARQISSIIYDSVYSDRNDVDFYLQLANKYCPPSGRILECGCGTGRIAIPLAKAGFTIEAFDNSQERLNQFQEEWNRIPQEAQARISITNSDLTLFQFETQFSLIIMPFRVFQHILTKSDQKRVLQRFTAHLNDNGRILIDIFNPSIQFLASHDPFQPFGPETLYRLSDTERCRSSQRVCSRDYYRQVQECEEILEIIDDQGEIIERMVWPFSSRYTFQFELANLLESEGLTVEATWGDYDFTPFGEQDYPGEILMLAKLRE